MKLVCPRCTNDDPKKLEMETRYFKEGRGGPHHEGHVLTGNTICKMCMTVFKTPAGAGP